MREASKVFIFLIPVLAIVYFLGLISSVLMPFVVGIIVAYFLDPAADKMETKGFSRGNSTLIILFSFFAFITILVYLIGPILYRQSVALLSSVPGYVKVFSNFITPYTESFYEKLGYEGSFKESGVFKEISEYAIRFSKNIASDILSSSFAFINLVALLFITPIVSFYLLRDWDRMVKLLDRLIPNHYRKTVEEQFAIIDKTLSAYIRGQTNVCLLLGAFYALSLTMVGLKYGFLIGFLTGLFSFIPYFGVFIGMIIGMTVALFQFDSYLPILLVLSIFLIGQFVEGNFITPKLVGGRIGIHPVLIIFALLVGGALFGFLGILFAIPAIAVIGVLTRFAVKNYLQSDVFLRK
jgi:predicted PurR-regulated permease PerM